MLKITFTTREVFNWMWFCIYSQYTTISNRRIALTQANSHEKSSQKFIVWFWVHFLKKKYVLYLLRFAADTELHWYIRRTCLFRHFRRHSRMSSHTCMFLVYTSFRRTDRWSNRLDIATTKTYSENQLQDR